ncbi:hypothetical protein OROGR_019944 [Orobanche gracilis]
MFDGKSKGRSIWGVPYAYQFTGYGGSLHIWVVDMEIQYAYAQRSG